MAENNSEKIKDRKTIIGTGLAMATVIAVLTLSGYDISEQTYYCSDTGLVLDCLQLSNDGTVCNEELCSSKWKKVTNIEDINPFTIREKDRVYSIVHTTDNATLDFKSGWPCVVSYDFSTKDSEKIFDKEGKQKETKSKTKVNGKDGYCFDPEDEYNKVGENSTILVSGNERIFYYTPEHMNITISVKRLVGETWYPVIGDFWIINNSFGLQDIYADGNNHTYGLFFESTEIWSIKEDILKSEKTFAPSILSEFFPVINKGVEFSFDEKENDICSYNWSNCSFSLNGTYANLTFISNGTIDPTLSETFSLSYLAIDWQINRTEVTDFGVRQHAPILFMDFNKENESTYVQDNSIYNNYGMNDGATWNSSCGTTGSGFDLGGCYEFDGVDDYVTIPYNSNLNFNSATQDFSAFTWARWNDPVAAAEIILEGREANNDGWVLWTQGSVSGKLYASIDTLDFTSNTNLMADEEWHYVGITVDRDGNLTFYADGVADGGGSVNSEVMDTTFGVNLGKSTTGVYWDGSIDQVQIWDRALSADEVLALYNGTKNNSNYIGKYASDGDFKSLVFYNETSTYWNTTFSLADSTGGYGVNLSDPNLVSYWTLDESFDDLVGGNDGTQSGGVTNATGISSGAMRFDGEDDYITAPNSIGSFSTFTVSAWYYREVDASSDEYIFARARAAGTGSDNWMYIDDSSQYLCALLGGTQRCSNEVPGNNAWHHAVVTYNGTNVLFYTDGSFIRTVETSIDNPLGDFKIGINYAATAGNWNGLIDEVLIYNKALSASEVEDLYKAGLTQHANANVTLETRTADSYNVSDSGLVGLWGLNGNANDSSNNGIHGEALFNTIYNQSLGIVDKSAQFDGTDDVINVTYNPLLNLTSKEKSYGGWFYIDTTGTTRIPLQKHRGNAGSGSYLEYAIWFRSGNDIVCNANGGGSYDQAIGSTYEANKWYHVMCNQDADSLDIYINGVLVGSDTSLRTDGISSELPLYIGAGNDAGSLEWDGAIDEVRIYNRSLSAEEIQNLYELGSYHIEWNDWDSEGVMTDLTPKTSTSQGNFFQYRASFATNDTDVSSYIINYTVEDVIAGSSGTNVTLGNGISSLIWRVPFHTGTEAYNVEPEGQTSTIGIFQAYNNGTLAGNLKLRFDDTYPNVITWCSSSNDMSGYITVNTTYQILESDVLPESAEQVKIWCKRNYTAIPDPKKNLDWDFIIE